MTPDQARISDDLLELKHRLEQWRATHPARSRLPETLWTTAAELAQRHGLNFTSKTLRLDYPGLKRRLAAAPRGNYEFHGFDFDDPPGGNGKGGIKLPGCRRLIPEFHAKRRGLD